VVLQGIGPGEARLFNNTEPHASGTCLKWTGAAAGTMLSMAPVADSSHYRLTSCAVRGIFFDGQESANIGMSLQSLNQCNFENLVFGKLRAWCIDLNVVGTLDGSWAEPRDLQHCAFRDIFCDLIGQTAKDCNGIRLNGATDANVSVNLFQNLMFNYQDGNCIDILNGDTNMFQTIFTIQGAGGIGHAMVFRGSATNIGLTARNNVVINLEPHTGGFVTEGGAFPAKDNLVQYNTGNAAPLPTIGTGSTMHYYNERWASQYGFNYLSIADDRTKLDADLTAQASAGNTLSIRNITNDHIRLISDAGSWVLNTDESSNAFRINPLAGAPDILLSDMMQLTETMASGDTVMLLRVNDPTGGISLQRVTLGSANSGGAGFRTLRVPN
jgi:hypothetical protein